jgi:hypothetical protein
VALKLVRPAHVVGFHPKPVSGAFSRDGTAGQLLVIKQSKRPIFQKRQSLPFGRSAASLCSFLPFLWREGKKRVKAARKKEDEDDEKCAKFSAVF